MGIIYTLSLIILTISFILVKKTQKKLNILSFINITIGVIFCYNTFVCYILTFFTIPVTLTSLSIVNIIIAIILFSIILKKRQIQTYEIQKIDLLYIAIFAITVLIVSYLNFGFPFNIKYETGDPAAHYLTSEMFAENDSLLITDRDEIYGSFTTRKTVSYVNSGLIMKVLANTISSFDNYNIFIIFGIFVLFITTTSMYTTLSTFTIDKKTRFLAFVVSLIYVMGYPLNSFLFGFEYLSMGILLICLIFDMVYYFTNKELKLPYIITIFALLNFGIFSAYYMFVPFIYSSLWIYFCIHSYEKDKKVITKKNITLLITTLLIPFFLGFIYHIAPEIYGIIINTTLDLETVFQYSANLVNTGLSAYGYIYVNLYSNIIPLLPLAIYLIVKKWKENKFSVINMIFCIAFIELLLLGYVFDKVSIYYLSKNYFILWFTLFYLNFKGLIEIYKKYPKVSFGIIGFYVILIILNLVFVNTTIEAIEFNTNERITAIVDIFNTNKAILKDKPTDVYNGELEILRYLKNNISYDNKIEVVGELEQGYWAYVLTRYIKTKDKAFKGLSGQDTLTTKALIVERTIEKADYIIYFNSSKIYKKLENKIHHLGNIIFENEYGGIVRCTK